MKKPAEGDPPEDAPTPGLTSKQNAVLLLLLTGSTVTAAAEKAKVNPATVHRWQKVPAFADAYREGLDGALAGATNQLKLHVEPAIRQLLAEMANPEAPPSCRVMAAREILVQTLKFTEHQELEREVADLAAQLKELEAQYGQKGGPR